MIQSIVSSRNCVTILGPSLAKSEDIDEVLRLAPVLVAADGGAEKALARSVVPDAVIGDLDSLAANAMRDLPPERLHRIDEQDSTDFEKCLSRITAPLCLAVGFLGRRVDHELAVMNTLVRFPHKPCVVVGTDDVMFGGVGDIRIDVPIGSRLSLMPLAPVRVTSQGLRWNVDNVPFDPAGKIGTSNEVTGPVRLTFDRPGMLVIMPRAALAASIQALTGGPPAAHAQ